MRSAEFPLLPGFIPPVQGPDFGGLAPADTSLVVPLDLVPRDVLDLMRLYEPCLVLMGSFSIFL